MPLRSRLNASVVSVTAKYALPTRARLTEQYIPFLVGTIKILRKVFSRDTVIALSKLRKSISEESIVAVFVEHLEVIRILNGSGARALIERYPHYVNKYVHGYLVKSFSQKSRRDILKFHHRYLAQHVTESFYGKLLQGRCVLWSVSVDKNCYAISMSFDSSGNSEGDISLTFDVNDVPIYEVSFTIVPGNIIGFAADRALLIARVQGRRNQVEAIAAATRACYRTAPPHLLLAAAQSIAAALAIDTIGGVTNKEQLMRGKEEMFLFDYDAFWETFTLKRKGGSVCEIQILVSGEAGRDNKLSQ